MPIPFDPKKERIIEGMKRWMPELFLDDEVFMALEELNQDVVIDEEKDKIFEVDENGEYIHKFVTWKGKNYILK
jgi:hypothetical protein